MTTIARRAARGINTTEQMNMTMNTQLTLRAALLALIVLFAVWHHTESAARAACNGDQHCLAASL